MRVGHKNFTERLNHRAQLWAMKSSVSRGSSASAPSVRCRQNISRADIVLPDPISRPHKRDFEHTFFGRGIVGHIAFADPICEEFRQII